jgi:hypothetical protein
MDAHVGHLGKLADGGADVGFPAGLRGGAEQVEDRRPQDQPGD